MKTCKTCRHWAIPNGTNDLGHYGKDLCEPVDPVTWEPMESAFEVRICMQPTQTRFERPTEATGFGLTDGSRFYAVLATAEAFGCVRHEDAAQSS